MSNTKRRRGASPSPSTADSGKATMTSTEWIGILGELDMAYDHMRSSDGIQQQESGYRGRIRLMRALAVLCLVAGISALGAAVAISYADRAPEMAVLAAAVALVMFVAAVMFESDQRASSARMERLDRGSSNQSGKRQPLAQRCERLRALLPEGYDDADAVSDMLRALTTGRATGMDDAQRVCDRFRLWREDERHEQRVFEECKRQTDAARRENNSIKAELERRQHEARRLEHDITRLQAENLRLQSHIDQYGPTHGDDAARDEASERREE